MDSVLRPRDIQARIRSGESPETVAAAAQTSIDRVMTFASPVLAERAFVAQQALKASVRRRTGDGAPGQLGAAVAERLATQHVEAEDVEWDAWRREDGRWTLVAEYDAQTGPERAEFVYDTAGRYVTATDEQSRWLVGERVTSGPGDPYAASGTVASTDAEDPTQMHLGDDAIELVTGQRPAPPVSPALPASAGRAPADTGTGTDDLARRRAGLRPAPHPVDALVDRADRTDAVEPEAPAAHAPQEPDEITVDLTDPVTTVRAGRATRPAGPPKPVADADWMATQASERPTAVPAPPAPSAPSAPPAPLPDAAAPAPEPEGLFEVPRVEEPVHPAATTAASASSEETVPDAEAPEQAPTPSRPARNRPAKTRSGKGRAAIPSWDEIMFGSSTSD